MSLLKKIFFSLSEREQEQGEGQREREFQADSPLLH